jgi:hypothetical protein
MVVPLGKVVDDDELATPDGESVEFRAMVSTNEVVIREAPDEVGEIVVKIVVTSCEALTVPFVAVAEDAASVRDAVDGEVCCALTANSAVKA